MSDLKMFVTVHYRYQETSSAFKNNSAERKPVFIQKNSMVFVRKIKLKAWNNTGQNFTFRTFDGYLTFNWMQCMHQDHSTRKLS